MLYKHDEAVELAKQWHYNTIIGIIYLDQEEDENAGYGVFHFHDLLFNSGSNMDLKELATYLNNAPGSAAMRITLFKDSAFNGNTETTDKDNVLHVSCQLSKENLKNMKDFNIDGFTVTLTAGLKELLHALLR